MVNGFVGFFSDICRAEADRTHTWRGHKLDEDDIVFTVFTDSMELYASRLEEAEALATVAGARIVTG